jgi:hypothetical protein
MAMVGSSGVPLAMMRRRASGVGARSADQTCLPSANCSALTGLKSLHNTRMASAGS